VFEKVTSAAREFGMGIAIANAPAIAQTVYTLAMKAAGH